MLRRNIGYAETGSYAGIFTQFDVDSRTMLGTWPGLSPANTALYSFTTATFTNGDTRSQNPASNAVLLANIAGTPTPSTWYSTWLSISSGYLTWTVPKDGTYRITAAGAAGLCTNGTIAGIGAVMRGDFTLVGGTTLKMLIGQRGVPAYGSAGGGGTYVATSANSPLIVAGGGGGSSYNNNTSAQYDINATTSQIASGRGGFGGTSGGGGASYANSGGCGGSGAGGGGFTGNGQQLGGVQNALSFVNGGTGGQIQSGDSGLCVSPSQGGFGGGGGGGNTGPGGGGYNGGDADTYRGDYYAGNGGSSFNAGSNPSNSVANNGSGYITITAL
jgi:hypothetical protein